MDFKRPAASEVELGLRALKTVVLSKAPALSSQEREMLAGLQRVFGTDFDVDSLTTIEPEELAAGIDEPQIRRQIVYGCITLSMIDEEIEPSEVRQVEAFARALEVDEKSIASLRKVADHHLLILRFDVLRRFWAIDKLRERIQSEGSRAFLRFAVANAGKYENPELAARYRLWRDLPDGTLGREYVRYVDANGFGLPGEKGAVSEIIVYHDMTHVLAGYGTDPAGEVQVACFSAGYRKREPFTFVMFVLLQFHVGIRMTPGAQAERGFFDVERALRALQRGAVMNVDLSDGWDYWPVVDQPVETLRERYGIPPR